MTIKIKFVGIDGFNCPIFKQVASRSHFGSTDKLFSDDADESEVLKTVSEEDLCYFGNSFGCEPMGTRAGDIEILRPEPEDGRECIPSERTFYSTMGPI